MSCVFLPVHAVKSRRNHEIITSRSSQPALEEHFRQRGDPPFIGNCVLRLLLNGGRQEGKNKFHVYGLAFKNWDKLRRRDEISVCRLKRSLFVIYIYMCVYMYSFFFVKSRDYDSLLLFFFLNRCSPEYSFWISIRLSEGRNFRTSTSCTYTHIARAYTYTHRVG